MGTYPEVGLKAARDRRDEARALLAEGIDPALAQDAEVPPGRRVTLTASRLARM